MRTVIILLAFCVLSCETEPQQTIQSSNPELMLELLFEHDGYKVYRFQDGPKFVYWSDCRGSIQSSHSRSNGKTRTTVYDYSLNTGRQ